jgi:hypothetical protein
VYVALALLLHLTVWQSPLSRHLGGGDAELIMWFLNWPAYALPHLRNPFLTTYISYPNGINMLWNATMMAPAVLLWPVTTIWGAVISYNVITTASMALSAFFGFLAIRRYVHGALPAAVGGLIFGFSPAVLAQQGHAQVALSAVTIPLALLLLDELLVRQRLPLWLMGGLIGALGIFQFFVFEEFFATEIIFGLVVTLVLAVMRRDLVRQRFAYAARGIAIGGALAVAVLAYPFVGVQLDGPDQPRAFLHDANIFSTDLLNPVLPTRSVLVAPGWATAVSKSFSGNMSEANGYVGVPLLVVSVFALVRYRRVTAVRAAAVTALIITALSLGPHLHLAGHDTGIPLAWAALSRLPLLRNILPSRMMSFVFLAMGVLLAFVLSQSLRSRWAVPVSAVLIALVLVPLVPPAPLHASTLSVPQYFSTAAVDEIPAGAVAFTIPFPAPTREDALMWQIAAQMRFKLIGSGNAFGPFVRGQGFLRQVAFAFVAPGPAPVITARVRTAFLRQLRANHIGVVMVGPIPDQSAAAAFCASVLGFAPHTIDGLDVWVLGPRRGLLPAST